MAEIGGLSNEIAVARAVRENAAADLRIMAPELAGKLVEELTACGIQDRLFKNYVGQMPYFEYHLIPVERRRGRLNRTKEKSMALVAMEFDRGDVSYHLLHDPAAGTDSERPVSRYNLGFGRRAELASPEVLAEFVQDLPRIIDHLRNKLNANGQRLVNAAAKAEQAWGLDWSLDRSAAASA